MSPADWKAGAPPYATTVAEVDYRLRVARRALYRALLRGDGDRRTVLSRRLDDLLDQRAELVRQEVAS